MILEVWTFVLLGGWLILWAWRGFELPPSLMRAWPAWVLLALWILLQVIHVIPLPADLVALLSPEAARVERAISDVGIARESLTLSVDPNASRISLIKTCAYVSIFFLVLALANTRGRVLLLARVLVYAALVHSVYAVLMHLGGTQSEYFGVVFNHGDSASGFYPNRNHFAGYLEMNLAIGTGLLIAGLSDRSADTWKKFLRLTIEWILSPKMMLRLSLCVLVIALTTTHSRMGNTAFFSSLLISGVIGICLARYATRNTVILLASLVVIDLVIVGSWFGVEKLAQRIEQTTAQEVQEREDPAAYSVDLIRDYPVFGTGPGTFYVAFPRYRQEKVRAFFEHAHNDYAQFASESGLLGFSLLAALVGVTLAAAMLAQWRRRDPLMRGMAFACIMGVTSILIHSWTDFNLQIPANATLFMVLLALGWIALSLDRSTPTAPRVRSETD